MFGVVLTIAAWFYAILFFGLIGLGIWGAIAALAH
jgi:hypothetical protein